MTYSRQDVERLVEEENVRFIRLNFCDLYGNLKHKTIMAGELSRAFDYGISADAWTVAGFDINESRSDIFLHPEPSAFKILPWYSENEKTARMFCRITLRDGRPFEGDSRYILERAVEDAGNRGLYFTFGAEQEFYLFERDEKGKPTKKPWDNGSYLDEFPEDCCEDIRREICIAIESMGIIPESSHHEEGPGQNEIDYRADSPVVSADNALTFRSAVKTIAEIKGLYADFSPKPLEDRPGNGMHVNFTVADAAGNDLVEGAAAGILAKMPEMTVFMNPEEASYRRLGGGKAPGYITWAYENRSQLIRLKAACEGYRIAELRSPDSASNPYLVYALIIQAALSGIENDLKLPEETAVNLFKAEREELKKYQELPNRLNEARYNAASSDFIKGCFPMSVIAAYVK